MRGYGGGKGEGIMIEQAIDYVNIIPTGLIIFVLVSLRSIDKKIDSKTSKDYADETFQSKDMCDQRYGEIKEDLTEIKTDVKELLTRPC